MASSPKQHAAAAAAAAVCQEFQLSAAPYRCVLPAAVPGNGLPAQQSCRSFVPDRPLVVLLSARLNSRTVLRVQSE